ncbi:periplasmic heavy metal sensor [Allomuricauda sp. CP2A]|jgi:hypothetical protein|uniref:periplasmic heavy metal sensor n=1 Tax=Allomuricauda sp. CP2A TaxID=1848189 RepID=UPI00083383FC|nr:periplasmic heavy metal sensor [Muricauda sp. CP2A]
MNKKVLILIVFLAGALWVNAQGPNRDRIKTLKVAFITERVGLTSQEAQEFWPVYNEHEDALEGVRRRERQYRLSSAQDLSESESAALLDNLLALQTEKHNADKTFILKIRKIISPKKVLSLLKAEDDFKKRLLQQYRRRQEGG